MAKRTQTVLTSLVKESKPSAEDAVNQLKDLGKVFHRCARRYAMHPLTAVYQKGGTEGDVLAMVETVHQNIRREFDVLAVQANFAMKALGYRVEYPKGMHEAGIWLRRVCDLLRANSLDLWSDAPVSPVFMPEGFTARWIVDVFGQSAVAADLVVVEVQRRRAEERNKRWFNARWYDLATKHGLGPGVLRKAGVAGRIARREPAGQRVKGGSRTHWEYELESVCQCFSQYRHVLKAVSAAQRK